MSDVRVQQWITTQRMVHNIGSSTKRKAPADPTQDAARASPAQRPVQPPAAAPRPQPAAAPRQVTRTREPLLQQLQSLTVQQRARLELCDKFNTKAGCPSSGDLCPRFNVCKICVQTRRPISDCLHAPFKPACPNA